MTINELLAESYNIAQEKGWGEQIIEVPEMVALIHSEASEALESYRNKEELFWYNHSKGEKPEGIASEFADILIRIGHYSVLLGIDLDKALIEKLEYNRSRPYRHGGKKI